MTPERHQQIGRIYHEALELRPDERRAFLDQACTGDAELRQEVEELLAAHELGNSFIEAPALLQVPVLEKRAARAALTDKVISHYRVLDKIGEGGMGTVYRAEDLQLRRQVALKFLPGGLPADEGVRSRLMREARTSAALNHPNICTVYKVDQTESGAPFIAMELVRGETLHDLLDKSGPLPLKRLVHIAVQVAEALAEAHSQKIVHRDLKPQNVMIGPDDRVKVLDFGLAKFLELGSAIDGPTSMTDSSELSRHGKVIGTPAYMSPEQAQGQLLDSRSDIFSFGIVLYKMTTGRLPFEGPSANITLERIVESEPRPPGEMRSALPTDLERIVQRCLRKDPRERFNDTRDLVVDLKELQRSISSSQTGIPAAKEKQATRGRVWLRYAALGSFALFAVIAFVSITWNKKVQVQPPARKQITFTGAAGSSGLSPDGQFLAYVENTTPRKLIVQDLSGGQTINVFEGTEGDELGNPVWSPDGSKLLLFLSRNDNYFARTIVVQRFGGEIQKFDDLFCAAWSPDGKRVACGMVYVANKIVLAELATPKRIEIDLRGHSLSFQIVDWSPTGERLLLRAVTKDLGQSSIWTARPDGTEQQKVYESYKRIYSPRWSPDGRNVYFFVGHDNGLILNSAISGAPASADELWKMAVSVSSGRRTGEPKAVLTGLSAAGTFSISRDGSRFSYRNVGRRSNLWLAELKAGGSLHTKQLTRGTSFHRSPAISPDGRQVAFTRGDDVTANIFTMPFEGGEPKQITFFESVTQSPAWSPDGKRIVFVAPEGTSRTSRVWLVSAGGGQAKASTRTQGVLDLTWAPNPKIAYISREGDDGGRDRLLNPVSEEETFFLPENPRGVPLRLHFSPDLLKVMYLWWSGSSGRNLWVFSPGGRQNPTPDMLTRRTESTGSLAQFLDAPKYRNREIQLKATVKAGVSSSENRVFCFLSVLGLDDWRYMDGGLIQSAEWTPCTVLRRIDADAQRVLFGVHVAGPGPLWVDDVQVSVKDEHRAWQPVPIANPSFEDGDSPIGWMVEGYEFRTTTDTPDGRRGASLQALRLPEGDFVPLGWSPDSALAYALDIGRRRVVSIPAAGGPAKPIFELPWSDELRTPGLMSVAMAPDARRFIFALEESQYDAWLIDNFDPDIQ